MIVTTKLQEHFDSNREVSNDTLKYLLSLGIDERFAEQCKAMFDGIKADVDEVIAVGPIIVGENTRLQAKISKMDLGARVEISNTTREAANDRVYRSHKKAA
ncbi:MAG: hypothetical protein PHI37_05455 [Candidatus Gracilibacteria bacterium]|nr:hypothetical protein [Candidatus Gracilibacteria bacterium]